MKIDPESGKSEPVAIGGEMVLDQTAEKAYMYDHMWRQMKQKMLVADLYGADWDSYYGVYKKFLPYINNNYDYAEMVSELLGEMNVSHTGCYYSGQRPPTADATASLGLFMDYDFAGPGLKVAEVLSGGPLDKAELKIRAGHVIEKIDGQALDRTVDHYKLLNRKAGKLTLLSVLDPASGSRWEEAVKPISARRGERPALPALGPQPPGRGRPPVRRPPRLRPRPEHERRQLPDGHRGGPRPEPGQGGPDRRHPLQRRRQPPRHPGRFPERQEGLRHRAPRPARRCRAVQQVDQAVHRPDGREQLLRRPSLPGRVQGPGHRPDPGHARPRHGDVRLVGIARSTRPCASASPRAAGGRRTASSARTTSSSPTSWSRTTRTSCRPAATSRSRPRSRSC